LDIGVSTFLPFVKKIVPASINAISSQDKDPPYLTLTIHRF